MNENGRVSASWHELSEQLCRHFGATPRNRCLLWVDPAQADPFEDNGVVKQARVEVPIRHPRFDPVRAPYVVPLDLSCSADADLFTSSVELAWLSWTTEYLTAMRGQPICGWVSTTASASEVAKHWGRHCHLHLLRRQTRLLRFQDPGVREWLWTALSKTQQRAMLGPATEVVAIGRHRQLIHHVLGESTDISSSTGDDGLNRFPTLQLDQAQWDQVDDYATLHAAWLSWRALAGDEAPMVQAAGWERPVLRALTHADGLGLRDSPDRELFALHALQLGADFYRHPNLDGIWRKTRAGDFYGSSIEEVLGCPADQLAPLMLSLPDLRNEGTHGYQHQ